MDFCNPCFAHGGVNCDRDAQAIGYYRLMNDLAKAAAITEGATAHPSMVVSAELSDDLLAHGHYMTAINLLGINSYRGKDFSGWPVGEPNLFDEFESAFPDKGVVITEFGVDAWNVGADPDHPKNGFEDQASQAEYVVSLWNDIKNHGVAVGGPSNGGVVFDYADNWNKVAKRQSEDDPDDACAWISSDWTPSVRTHDYESSDPALIGGGFPDHRENHEWYGIVSLEKNPYVYGMDLVHPRQVYYALQEKFSATSDEIIVDNTDSGFSKSTGWVASTWSPDHYGANYLHDGSTAANSSQWAKWVPNIPTTGSYKVYMMSNADSDRPDAAPLEIKHSGGLDTGKKINQQINSGQWQEIGTYTLSAGTGNYVMIKSADAGYTIADAVKFVKVDGTIPDPQEVIVDNVDSGFSKSTGWAASTWSPDHYGANYLHDGSTAANSSQWAKWVPNIPTTGSYKVYMMSNGGSDRPDAAPLEIKHSGGLDTVKKINQQINSGQWQYIGTYTLNAGTGNYVMIKSSDTGYTIADAVKFVKVDGAIPDPREVIIDNVDSGFSKSTGWAASTWSPDHYGANYLHDGSTAANSSQWAKWVPNIPTTGSYKVYMMSNGGSDRPDAAPLEIKHSGGLDTGKRINQQINSGQWQYIGTYTLNAGTGNYVIIRSSDTGYTIADAVKFTQP